MYPPTTTGLEYRIQWKSVLSCSLPRFKIQRIRRPFRNNIPRCLRELEFAADNGSPTLFPPSHQQQQRPRLTSRHCEAINSKHPHTTLSRSLTHARQRARAPWASIQRAHRSKGRTAVHTLERIVITHASCMCMRTQFSPPHRYSTHSPSLRRLPLPCGYWNRDGS